jgi:hypothetical protein
MQATPGKGNLPAVRDDNLPAVRHSTAYYFMLGAYNMIREWVIIIPGFISDLSKRIVRGYLYGFEVGDDLNAGLAFVGVASLELGTICLSLGLLFGVWWHMPLMLLFAFCLVMLAPFVTERQDAGYGCHTYKVYSGLNLSYRLLCFLYSWVGLKFAECIERGKRREIEGK